MSIATTKAALRAVLLGIGQPRGLAKVYADPKEATSIAEFPCAIISLAPGVDQVWSQAAQGLARHDYTIMIYLFVGQRQSPIGELTQRAEQWPEPIMAALFSSLTLGGAVEWIGDVDTPMLFTYQEGQIQWGLTEKDQYWGLKIRLPVTEKISQEMGP